MLMSKFWCQLISVKEFCMYKADHVGLLVPLDLIVLGLEPPTMLLHPGGPATEMDQALLNCEAVANCFKSSIATSAIVIIVYCSASVSSFEMVEIQNQMEYFLKHHTIMKAFLEHIIQLSYMFWYPIFQRKNGESEVQSVLLKEPSSDIPNYFGFNYSDMHQSGCQINVVPGKICMALISAAKDHTGSMHSEVDYVLVGLHCDNSQKHMKEIALFFTTLIDKIISDNGFSWQDLKYLRFYFFNDLASTADFLFPIFSEAYSEFAESSRKVDASNEPLFNLLPVLGCGRSASMNDLVTCELFASKL